MDHQDTTAQQFSLIKKTLWKGGEESEATKNSIHYRAHSAVARIKLGIRVLHVGGWS
jgi:hypothetical protein